MKALYCIIILFTSTCLFSTIINVPEDQSTIQAGIDAAVDTDTVLVQPGTYFENINYNGKLITVASLFLTTQDTTYISQTVIDGSQPSNPDSASVVYFTNGEDSTAVLTGFTLTCGSGTLVIDYWGYCGGGIYCENSSPSLENIHVTGNSSSYGGGIYCNNSSPISKYVSITGNIVSGGGMIGGGAGGGIFCYSNSSPSLENVIISENITYFNGILGAGSGGGIYCFESNPILLNVTLSTNMGNGIYCSSSNPSLTNVIITDNCTINDGMRSGGSGGGIHCNDSSPSLVNVVIIGNSASAIGGYGHGGGIYCKYNSNPNLTNVTISRNQATLGGGIYCRSSILLFNPVERCNIFLNFASSSGWDLYADDCNTIDVIVDTFTVLQPDDYFAFPIENFTFDILNDIIEQVEQDLYVSPIGSDDNSGLTVDDPLLTISLAFTKILPSSTNPLTIHLSNGNYSPSGTGELFPLYCRNYVSLYGEDELSTILDGEELSGILYCWNDNNFTIENITIQNSSDSTGFGIYCDSSSPNFENMTVQNNNSVGIYCYNNSNPNFENVTVQNNNGGGISCMDDSNPSFVNVTISGNTANNFGGGISCGYNSNPSFQNVTISGNFVTDDYYGNGGGIWCYYNSNPNFRNVTVLDNYANNKGGGIYCENSSPNLTNVTISGNQAYYGGGIYCYNNSNPVLINSVLLNDLPQEIWFSEYNNPNSITISYSDIQGGEAGIVTNNNGTVNWLEGNIDEDPLFIGTGDHPFMLQDLSSCVNAGIPDTTGLNLPEFDLAGNPRVFGGRIDMGAYENQNVIVYLNDDLIPLVTKLNQNFPNPFNPTTTINYSLKENSKVSLNIYNIKGQKVKQLVREQLTIGQHSTVWNGKDDYGKSVSSGIYLYKLKAGNYDKTKRMILLK